ncbi:MAG: L,D-transpeptidase family protein [Hyphomicrobiaceae bacterium]|nr:L,D-transpeptidase family protein [Hyphomicrobiaceae bacterium]
MAIAAVALLSLLASTAAEAQFWWETPPSTYRRESRKPAPAPQRSEAKTNDSTPAGLDRAVLGAMIAVVSLNDQRITIYDAGGRILKAPVSSGTKGYETPVGLYSIIQKNRDHVSNLYDAEMPFMQRITWSGIALHAGVIPGYPASHGCVRLPYKVAEGLFDMTERGMRVVLVRQDMAPVEFSHPLLPKPVAVAALEATKVAGGEQPMRLGASEPEAPSLFDALKRDAEAKAEAADAAARKARAARMAANRLNALADRDTRFVRGADSLKSGLEAQIKYAEEKLAQAKDPGAIARAEAAIALGRKRIEEIDARVASLNAQPKVDSIDKAMQEAKEAEEQSKAAAEAAAAAKRRLVPVSIFISRATQRIYVRQGFEPVFDAPISIRDADAPIGTTLFTAMDHTGSEVRWTALAMYAKGMEPNARNPAQQHAQRLSIRSPEPNPTSAEDAKAVLDRIDMPEEVRERISQGVAPGSSLIVSDEGMHRETAGPGGGTDFIVLMPGEPQGGIAIRSRRSRDSDWDDDRPRRRRGGQPEYSWW